MINIFYYNVSSQKDVNKECLLFYPVFQRKIIPPPVVVMGWRWWYSHCCLFHLQAVHNRSCLCPKYLQILWHPHQIRFHLEGIHLIRFHLEGNHLSQLHLYLEGDQFHQILDLGLCSGVRHNDHIHHIHT